MGENKKSLRPPPSSVFWNVYILSSDILLWEKNNTLMAESLMKTAVISNPTQTMHYGKSLQSYQCNMCIKFHPPQKSGPFNPIGSMGDIYLARLFGWFSWQNVGKWTSPKDPRRKIHQRLTHIPDPCPAWLPFRSPRKLAELVKRPAC